VLINGGGGKSQGFANFVFPQLGKLVQDSAVVIPSAIVAFKDPIGILVRVCAAPTHDSVVDRDRVKVMHQYCGPPEAVMGRRTWSLHWSARLKGGCASTGQPH